MSLAVAVPLGVASAVVYGTSIVVQHRASSSTSEAGRADARGLLRLLRDPRWLMAMGGDFLGFLLNIAALSTGPVVVIQPLVVLMLPVALFAGYLMGGPRPSRGDYLGCLAIIAGLGTFLGLIGAPPGGHAGHARWVLVSDLAVLAVGVVICAAVRGRSARVRGATVGLAAGFYFGTLGVMVDSASDVVGDSGWGALVTTGRGLIPLIGILVLGAGGIALTQASFQIGALAATLPANIAADPASAVIIGAVLLHERLPHGPGYVVAYALCLAAVVVGAIRLARPAIAGEVRPVSPAEGATMTR
jgi:drug/metabolite transporter (DMT)-like permease